MFGDVHAVGVMLGGVIMIGERGKAFCMSRRVSLQTHVFIANGAYNAEYLARSFSMRLTCDVPAMLVSFFQHAQLSYISSLHGVQAL